MEIDTLLVNQNANFIHKMSKKMWLCVGEMYHILFKEIHNGSEVVKTRKITEWCKISSKSPLIWAQNGIIHNSGTQNTAAAQ